ncbi:hypothetical protein BG418_20065 [Streptomyces sp. CBMA152]|nr:hypothetical protein [Streptomyces sp. CBMA152]
MIMMLLAGQTEPSPGPFLLVWGLVTLIGGGVLATKNASDRFHAFVVDRLEQGSVHQVRARSVRPGFVRGIGSLFAVCGVIALPTSVIMMTRG